MTFDEYSRLAHTTAKSTADLNYSVIGLAGETGEVAEKWKRVLRDDEGILSYEKAQGIILELGDVLWYLNRIAMFCGASLEEVAKQNVNKLASRKARDKIGGSGDLR